MGTKNRGILDAERWFASLRSSRCLMQAAPLNLTLFVLLLMIPKLMMENSNLGKQ